MSLSPCAAELCRQVRMGNVKTLLGSIFLYLRVITSNARASIPSTDSNVCLAISEAPYEGFQLWKIFDGRDSLDVTLVVQMDAIFQRRFGRSTSMVPRRVELLHEQRVSFPS